jgi:hypothetical protein
MGHYVFVPVDIDRFITSRDLKIFGIIPVDGYGIEIRHIQSVSLPSCITVKRTQHYYIVDGYKSSRTIVLYSDSNSLLNLLFFFDESTVFNLIDNLS